jgi:hypothetical protein
MESCQETGLLMGLLYRKLTGVRIIAGPIVWKAVRRQVIAGSIV